MEHYDFSAVASMARNLLETYLAFFYLCVDDADDDQWLTRLNLMQLHDCVSRIRMFREFDDHDPQLPEFEAAAEELRRELLGHNAFATLPPKQQKRFLTGDYAWLFPQNESLAKIGVNVGGIRGFYRLLSAHVHSFPLAFYRMAERDQGRGIESEWEKESFASALDFAEDVVNRATRDMLGMFPDAALPTS